MALKITEIEAVLRAKAGNMSQAARALGVTRQAIQARVRKSEYLRSVVEAEREGLVDLAESVIRRNIERGDVASTIFVLKTLGKNRGYVERFEQTGANGGPIQTEELNAAGERILSRIDSIAERIGANSGTGSDSADTSG